MKRRPKRSSKRARRYDVVRQLQLARREQIKKVIEKLLAIRARGPLIIGLEKGTNPLTVTADSMLREKYMAGVGNGEYHQHNSRYQRSRRQKVLLHLGENTDFGLVRSSQSAPTPIAML